MEGKVEKKHPGRATKVTKNFLKHEDSLRNILDNMKLNTICIMGTSEAEENKQGIEYPFEEIMTENSLNQLKEKATQVWEAQRVPNNLDPKRPTPRHIKNKMTGLEDKERILKATREKWEVTYKGAPIGLSSDFSAKHFRAEGTGVKHSSDEN